MLRCLPVVVLGLALPTSVLGQDEPAPPAAPTTQEVLKSGRAEAEALIRQSLGGLEEKEPIDLDEAIRVELVDGLPQLETTLPAGRYAVPSSAGAGMVTIFYDPPEARRPRLMVRAMRAGPLDPIASDEQGTIVAYTNLSTFGGLLQFSQDSESLEGMRNIDLIFGSPAVEQMVRFHYAWTPNDPDAPGDPIRIEATADTLQEIRRDHLNAWRRFVVPAMEEIGLGEIERAIIEEEATQVFLADLPVEPEVAEELDELLPNLAAEEYVRRQQALARLSELGRPAASELARRLRDARVPELARPQIEAFLANWRPMPRDLADFYRHDPQFLRAASKVNDPALRAAAERRLAEVTGNTASD